MEMNNYYVELNVGNKYLYRARKVEDIELSPSFGISACVATPKSIFHGYDAYRSKEPPITVGREGRNNIKGMSYLYLSEDKYTAIAELKEKDFVTVSLAEFEIKKKMRLLNLANMTNNVEYKNIVESIPKEYCNKVFIERLLHKIMYQFSNPYELTDGYLASQYIADYVRKQGIDGLMYRSSCTDGINYTIFNSGKKNIEFVDSKLVYIHSRQYKVIDLETKEIISPISSLELDDGVICNIQRAIVEKYNNNSKEEG